MVTKALVSMMAFNRRKSVSTVNFLMSLAIKVSRVKVICGNKKSFVRWNILLHICVQMKGMMP